jgi:hypothetical protein
MSIPGDSTPFNRLMQQSVETNKPTPPSPKIGWRIEKSFRSEKEYNDYVKKRNELNQRIKAAMIRGVNEKRFKHIYQSW